MFRFEYHLRDGFAIERAKVEADAKFDGVLALRTNAGLLPLQTMLVCNRYDGVTLALQMSGMAGARRKSIGAETGEEMWTGRDCD